MIGGEAIGIVGPSGAESRRWCKSCSGSGRRTRANIWSTVSSQQFRTRIGTHASPTFLRTHVSSTLRSQTTSAFPSARRRRRDPAAQLAGIHQDVMDWSAGYETVVGPRADAISGGQQQRICLARALAGNPDVLVLDEPTSALDPHSELLIRESLATLKHKLTLFVVAHRMSTLDICERVMVLVGGRLEAFDRIDALRITSVYYRSVSEPRDSSLTVPVRVSESDPSV